MSLHDTSCDFEVHLTRGQSGWPPTWHSFTREERGGCRIKKKKKEEEAKK